MPVNSYGDLPVNVKLGTIPPGYVYCSGSFEPESSYHDRDWIIELPWRLTFCQSPGVWHQRLLASCFVAPSPAEASEIVHQDALVYLNSVRAWARLFHVSASRGLRPIAAEPQSAQGGTMEQSSRWAKICHFSEMGHWSRSLAAFFFRKILGD